MLMADLYDNAKNVMEHGSFSFLGVFLCVCVSVSDFYFGGIGGRLS